jgi:hypothetical protein
MPKYMIAATYAPKARKESSRRAVAADAARLQPFENLKERMETFYFAFRRNDVYVTLQLPDKALCRCCCSRDQLSPTTHISTTFY